MAKKNRRFVVALSEGGFSDTAAVLVDKETGVNYLYYQFGTSGGLTPLLDREGKPVVTTVFEGLE